MTVKRVATLIGDPELEAAVAGRIGSDRDVELVMRCVDRVELLALVRSRSIDGVVSVGHPHWLDAETVQEATDAHVRIVGVSDHPLDVESFQRAAIAIVPSESPLPEILDRLSSEEPAVEVSQEDAAHEGKLIAAWGPKGSPGRTTVAIELAACLAAMQPRTLLADCDPYGGDILQRLGIIEDVPTIIWAARRAGKGEWDASLVAEELRRAGPRGPVVLPGIPRAELWAEVSDYGLQRLLADARRHFAFTVADVGFCLEPGEGVIESPGRNRMARSIVGAADRVIAVLGPDPFALKAFVSAWPELLSLADEEDIVVVGNRLPLRHRKELSEALRASVGRPLSLSLPDVYGDAQWAMKRSRSIFESRPRCSLCDEIRSLAALLGGQVQKKGILTRLGGKA